MNATLLMLTTTLAAGGDVIPAGWGQGPVAEVKPAATPCSNCDPLGPCFSRGGLIDRLKSKFGVKSSDCGCAPAPCDPCASASRYYQPNLVDKLKERWGSKKTPNCTTPCPSPCGPTVAPGTVVPSNPPAELPKSKDPVKPKDPSPQPKGSDKSSSSGIPPVRPIPDGITLPPLPTR